MIGWVLIIGGAVLASVAVKYFFKNIGAWLNNTAANAVERALGYNARKFMQRAVSRVTRLRDNLKNVATIFTKRNRSDSFFQKVTLESSAPVYEQSSDVLKELEKTGELTAQFSYGDSML